MALNWNNNTATSYQVFRKEGSGGYVAISPVLTTTSFADTAIMDRHTYAYKVWSNKDTLEKYSNELTASPTCPCLAPRVVNTSDGLCHDPISAICLPSSLFVGLNQTVTWTAVGIIGGTGTYTYSWS